MKATRRSNFVLLAGASALAMTAGAQSAIAQEDDESARTLSTVVVTTQKTEESIQDVPIAVSAFDPDALERLNIDTGSDLQFNIPNFGSTQGNFSAGGISIRGIINAAVGASSDAAVGTHVNGVSSSGSTLLETEFYDVERIEILRGPQGTLYGRNATGGVVNAITAKPVLEEFNASAELTVGEFNNVKATGHINVPLGERFAARFAGFRLTRDGYSDAILPDGSTEDVDGRDLWSIRGTFGGDVTDKLSVWVMAEHYEEDSTRTRATKQLCTKDTRPFPFNQGCVPYQIEGLGYARDANGNPIQVRPGFGTVNTGGTLGGVLGASLGLLNGFGADTNAGATTSTNLREFETNLIPTFEGESNTVQAEFQYEFDNDLTFTFLASHNDNFREFTDDYNKGIGTVGFNITPLTPDLDGDGDNDIYVANRIQQNKVWINGFSQDSPYITANTAQTFTSALTGFSETLSANNQGSVSYQVSTDNGTTWNYWNGTAWTATTKTGGTETSSATVINTNIGTLDIGGGAFLWRAFFHSNGTQRVELDQVEVSYATELPILSAQCNITLTPPSINAYGGTVTATTTDATVLTTQGTHTINWLFGSSGTATATTASQTVVIQDTIAPVVPTLTTVTGQCSTTVATPTTTDNCSGVVTGTTTDTTVFSSQGTHTILWTFTDAVGNSSSATQTVVIQDTTPPDAVAAGIMASCTEGAADAEGIA